MPYKVFQWRDLLLMWIPALIIGLIVAAVIYTATQEPISVVGWVVAIVSVTNTLSLVVVFYVLRWKFVRTYKYTVRGIHYFYEDGCEIYPQLKVRENVDDTLRKWDKYYASRGHDVVRRQRLDVILNGISCMFKPEGHWTENTRWWRRKVAGIAYADMIKVGQGGRRVENTAHAHELSHPIWRRYEHYNGPDAEEESHAVFKEVGV